MNESTKKKIENYIAEIKKYASNNKVEIARYSLITAVTATIYIYGWTRGKNYGFKKGVILGGKATLDSIVNCVPGAATLINDYAAANPDYFSLTYDEFVKDVSKIYL